MLRSEALSEAGLMLLRMSNAIRNRELRIGHVNLWLGRFSQTRQVKIRGYTDDLAH